VGKVISLRAAATASAKESATSKSGGLVVAVEEKLQISYIKQHHFEHKSNVKWCETYIKRF